VRITSISGWKLSDCSQSEQPSQDQVNRHKIVQEAGHDEDQHAKDDGKGRAEMRYPYRHFQLLSPLRFDTAANSLISAFRR
jgi:hypothetical protein